MKNLLKRNLRSFPLRTILFSLSVISLLLLFNNSAQAALPNGATAPNWTLTDLNGNSHTLYDILDQDKMVVLDFSATWCPPCWSYHNSGILETLYEDYGPDGTDEVMVFFIEPDQSTNVACLYGPSGCVGGTTGDWVSGTPYPIINTTSSAVGNQYNITYFPTLYAVCPDRTIFEPGQISLNSWLTWIETCSFEGNANSTNALCAGEGSGTIDLSPSGGYGGTSYSWSNGETTQDLTNLEAGDYSVTMTEGHGYMIELGPFTVGGPTNPLEIVTNAVEDIDCAGNGNGSIDTSPSGGTPGYSYLWNTGQSTNSINSLIPGNYVLTLTDNNNCTEIETFAIAEPPVLSLEAIVINENCNSGDGQIIAQGSGGSPSYNYDIGFGSQNSGSFSDLIEGVYYLTITDDSGCMEFEDVVIISSQVPTADAGDNMNIDCSLPQISLDGTASSSGPNISYFWSTIDGNIVNGENSMSPLVDAIGLYDLLVYNTATGCEETSSAIVIGDISTPDADAGPAETLTCSNNTVTLDGSASQGGPSISYQWTTTDGNIASGADSTAPVVDASGTYTLIVTDNNNGCSSSANTIVDSNANLPAATANSPAVLNCNTPEINLDGNGSSTGTDFSYLWSTSDGNIASGATSLNPTVDAAGTYSLLVTNNENGCTASANTIVDQNAALPDADAGTAADLNCSTTALTLDGSNSESGANITYLWSTTDGNIVSGATSLNPVVDNAGTYTLTVNNSANGCSAASALNVMANITIPDADAGSANPITCSNNSITLDGSNSSSGSNINYLWSTSNGNIVSGGTSTAPVVDADGTYALIVTNSDNGCTASSEIIVTENTNTPAASAGTAGQLNCTNTSLSLDGSGSSSGSNISYNWTTSNGNIVSGADSDSPVVDLTGTYALVVTNNDNGCTASANTTVSQNANLPTADAGNASELNCNTSLVGLNGNNSSGGSNIEYLWSTTNGNIVSGEDGTAPDVDEAGEYTLLVTNTSNGCSSSSSVSVSENLNAPTADAGNTDQLNCNNITITLDGTDSSSGSNFEYEWDTNDGNIASGANTATPTIDDAGSYSLMVTNTDNGCTNSAQVNITQATPLALALDNQSNVLCQGDNDASATIEADGGNGPYEYSWPGGGDEATESDLSAGTYVATVTDNDDCMQTISVTITEPNSLSVNATSSNETAAGANDGSATATPDGGAAGYTYSWSNGESTASINNLEPGLYSVEITDANNCTSTETVTVNSFNCVVTANISGTDINCFSGNNGTATASLNGGNGPYSYQWSNGGSTETINNLSAGTYEVTISDDNNCPATALITITQPTAVNLALTASTEVTCNGMANGSATVDANGGNNSFTYDWSNGTTGATANNLAAGTYTVTASDGNQCSTTINLTVTEPNILSTTLSSTDETIAGANDGSATANPSGGNTPYSYLWSNGATNSTATNLAPGTYSVVITDDNNCTTSQSIVINGISCNLLYNISSQQVSCFEENNGTISINPPAGNPSFNYNWSTGATTSSISDLPAGSYLVSISDDNGCESVEQIVIQQPVEIQTNITVTEPNCSGNNDGNIMLVVSGGSQPYTFAWQDGSNNFDYPNAGPGQYSVTVTDINGCTQIRTTSVNEPAPISTTTSTTNTSTANSNDGTASVTPTGGTGDFSFLWTNGATTQEITNLAPGSYSVVISDENNCSTSATIIIQGINCTLNSNITNTNTSCSEDANGTATISVTGSDELFQYLWSNDATTATVSGLSPGSYSVTATDPLGCFIIDQVTITAPVIMATLSTAINQPTCNEGTDGSIQTNTSGGTGLYTYLWSNGSTNAELTNAPAGDYNLQVTDINGCTSTASYTLTAPSPVSASIVSQTDVQCGNDGTGTAMANATGGTGNITYLWSNGQTGEQATGLNADTYSVVATDANGCSNNSTVSIIANDDIAPSAVAQDVSISLDGNGMATIDADMVDAFSFDNCEITSRTLDLYQFDCANLGENIVQFTVTDGAGNTSMTTAMVTVLDNISPIITCDQTTVMGNCSEVVNYVLPTGADNCSANPAELLIGLGSGAVFPVGNSIEVYRVTDNSGNSSTCSFTVVVEDTEAPEITCTSNIVLTGCAQEVSYNLPSAIDACSTVGTPTLMSGLGTGSIFPVGTTTETYEVADGAGNTTMCSFTITITNDVDGTISALQNSCYDQDNGSATVTGSGGAGPYAYDWGNGQTTSSATDLSPASYSVIVTDVNGCSNQVFVTISANPEISSALDNLQDESGSDANGAIAITPEGGSGDFTYEWTSNNGFFSTDEDIVDLTAGTYSCIITDSEGCSIPVGPFVVASVTAINDPAFAAQVSIYPNPTSGEVQINLSENLKGADIAFEVFSITGQQLKSTVVLPLNNNAFTLDISTEVNGIYLVKIRIDDEILVKRIVLNRD
ncbi:MAG: thiol-disulfide isomerase/thioredoxin [Saprospiraceae bacterium]|jgi:thiol-disulfide isomerase/thioredoxin